MTSHNRPPGARIGSRRANCTTSPAQLAATPTVCRRRRNGPYALPLNSVAAVHESVTFGLVRPPTDQPMDVVQGRKLLRDLLALLPPNWWFPLIQQDSQHGIATVFKRSRGEIDALLVNAGLAKVTSKGLRFQSGHPWESFKLSEGADLHYGSTRREQFVASVQPPGEPHK